MKTILTLIISCISIQYFYAQQVDFLEHTIYKNKINNPFGIRSVDLDGDGFMDYVITSEEEGKVFWLKNDGFQNYSDSILIETCVNEQDFEVEDIDGDGDLDILYICSNTMHLMENDGNQNFTDSIIHQHVIFDLNGLEIGDVDLDGDLDIVTYFFNEIYILRNNGNTEFIKSHISYMYSTDTDFEIVDMDDDGDMDIFGIDNVLGTNLIRYYEFDVDSGYSEWYEFDQIDLPENGLYPKIIIDDLDDDGDKDFIVGSQTTDSLFLFTNDGSEEFTMASLYMSVEPELHDIYIEDIDSDGDKDIIVLGNDILILENDGSENFTEHIIYQSSNYGVGTSRELVDLDNDGDLDLSILYEYNDEVLWFENSGNLSFVEHHIQEVPMGAGKIFLPTDLDQDSDLDILVLTEMSHNLFWFENDGYENFSYTYISDTMQYIDMLSVSDIDSDGDQDILAGSKTNERILWLENDGAQNYTYHLVDDSLVYLNSISHADLNNDGFTDLITGGDGFLTAYMNDGFENFTTESMMDSSFAIYSIKVKDIDLDGDIDVFARSNEEKFLWFENDGLGNFSMHIVDLTAGYGQFFIEDFDNDGDDDIILTNSHWLKNDGSNNFTEHSHSFAGWGIKEVDDINDDGYWDILAKNVWYSGDSLYNFTIVPPYFNKTIDAFSVDIDLDGDIDIFTLSQDLDEIIWVENLLYNNYIKMIGVPFVDQNNNGIYDAGDNAFQNVMFNISPQGVSTASVTDTTVFFMDTMGIYTISINLDTVFWEATTPLEEIVNVNSTNFYDTLYFGVQPKEEIAISSDIIGMWPRCLSVNQYTLNVINNGSNIDTAYAEFVLQDSAEFVNSLPAPDSINGDTLYFHFNNLLTSHSKNIELGIRMPLNIMPLEYEMKVYADTGQWIMIDSIGYSQVVKCSYDPNDKQVFPNYGDSGYILNNQTELEYLIRFQNTGNDTAFVVELKDTLDTNLDISSFKLIATSHPYTSVEIDSNGVLTFLFDNINLTDTVTNEPESHGFAKFSIRAKENLPVNTSITNKASIYFDFNPPIVTNTTLNTIYDCNTLGNSIEINVDNIMVSIDIDEPFLTDAYWTWNGDTIHDELYGFGFFTNLNDIIELTAHLENDLCVFDTTYTIYTNNVGMVENAGKGKLSVFPNPTSGIVYLDLGEVCDVSQVRVSTMSGKLLQQNKYTSTRLLTLNLPEESGVYLIELVKEDNKTEFVKVVKY